METTNNSKMNATKISLSILAVAAVAAIIILAPKSQQLAAQVNSQKITKKEFDLKMDQTLKILKSFSGEETEFSEEQFSSIQNDVLNGLISEALVKEYAEDNKIMVTNEELDQEYALIASNSGGEEQLESQLRQFGISQSQFLEDIKKDLTLKKSVENYSGSEAVEVPEEEIRSAYDAMLEQAKQNNSEAEIPPFEEAREFLAMQMKNQKILENSQIFIEELKSGSEIKIYI